MSEKKLDENLGNYTNAFLSGMGNAPLEVGKYAHLAGNRFNQLVNGGPDKLFNDRAAKIEQTFKDPAYFPKEVNQYRNQLSDQFPVTSAAGEVAVSALGGAGMARPFVNLIRQPGQQAKLYRAPKMVQNILPNAAFQSPAHAAAFGGAAGLAGEVTKEPMLDQYLGSK